MKQWSVEMPHTAREDRGSIRRSDNVMSHPELGADGCRTLYEALRRGGEVNPLGPCLGFRAISTSGFATPYVYSSYTESIARVDAFAAGLDRLELVQPNDDNLLLVSHTYRYIMTMTTAPLCYIRILPLHEARLTVVSFECVGVCRK